MLLVFPWFAKGAALGVMGLMNSSSVWLENGDVVTDEVVQVHFGNTNCYYKVFNSDGRLMERDYEDVTGIKVLEIHPPGAEHLTEWFGPLNVWRARHRDSIPLLGNVYQINSVGEITSQVRSAGGIFDIYCVTIDEFNQLPTSILRQNETCRNGWNYDVVCFGFNDGNMTDDDNASVLVTYSNGAVGRVKSKYLSPVGAEMMKRYLQSGGGTVFGHDTIVNSYVEWGSYWADAPERGTAYNLRETPDANHFMELASYCGIVLNNEQPALSTRIIKNRDGLLTKYPFPMTTDDPEGKSDYIDLSLTPTHSLGQANVESTVWYTLGNTRTPYLQTYLNTAVTQAGHTNHAYNSEKERKLLANTLFYVNQFLFSGDWIEVEDMDAPATPQIRLNHATNQCSFETEDQGTVYELTCYMWNKNNVANMRDRSTADYVSNTISVNSKTGVAGYYYIIDNLPDTVIAEETVANAGNFADISPYLDGDTTYYIHVAATDKNGNYSETAHMELNQAVPSYTVCLMYDERTQMIDKVISTQMQAEESFFLEEPVGMNMDGYTFIGYKVIRQSDDRVLNNDRRWTPHQETDAENYKVFDGSCYVTLETDWCNENAINGDVFTFVGIWRFVEKGYYTIAFDKNAPDANGETLHQVVKYDKTEKLRQNGFTRENHAFLGWSVLPEGEVLYDEGADIYNLVTPSSGTTVYRGIDYATIYNFDYYISAYGDIRGVFGNNPKGALAHFVESGMREGRNGCAGFQLDFYKATYADLVATYGEDNEAYYNHYMNTGIHEGRWGNAAHGAVVLYAVWDSAPWLMAEDLYFTLYEAQQGYITYDLLMSYAKAYDKEDDSEILPGTDEERGTCFQLTGYEMSAYTQLTEEACVEETYELIDSGGNQTQKTIRVFIIDSEANEIIPSGTTRFINEKYYNLTYEEGGLLEDSVWKTNEDYRNAMEEAFLNSKNKTPVMQYSFTYEDIRSRREE